jgi:hypothetical protein
MLENTKGSIKTWHSRETGNTGHTIQRKTQHNMGKQIQTT